MKKAIVKAAGLLVVVISVAAVGAPSQQRDARVPTYRVRSILAEAAAEPLEHAAGDRHQRRQHGPHLVHQPQPGGRGRRDRRRRQPAAHRLLHPRPRGHRARPGRQRRSTRGAAPGNTRSWPTAMQTVIADSKGFVWIAGTAAAGQHPEVHARRQVRVGLRPSSAGRGGDDAGEQPGDELPDQQGRASSSTSRPTSCTSSSRSAC